MKIVLIDVMAELERCFAKLGHTLKIFRPGGGVFYLPALLERDNFKPDFVLQQECLGIRNYYGGLEHLPCPTAFWAIDSHLNMYWHCWYARLFDIVLTPHVSLFAALPEPFRHGQVCRFAWPGEFRAFVPHEQRATAMGLCARVTLHRPLRLSMVELLRPHRLALVEGLNHETMMRFYDDTKVVPNECIANEVNFRLMEGASSGSVVLSPDVGEDQNALLEPGKEFLIYRDGVDLLELATWTRANRQQAEAIGRAAMRRIQAEHLPEHRVSTLLRAMSSTGHNRLTGHSARIAFWLALAYQLRNGALPLDAGGHAEEGLKLVRTVLNSDEIFPADFRLAEQAIVQVFLLFAERPQYHDRATALYRDVTGALERRIRDKSAEPSSPGDRLLLSYSMVAVSSAFALREGQTEVAKMLWLHSDKTALPRPGSAGELCALWAGAQEKKGQIFNSGFCFEPQKGFLPEDAFAWLVFARQLGLEGTFSLTPSFAGLFAMRPQYLSFHMGYLAEYSLADSSNWRVQQAFGVSCIQAFKVAEGLCELREAKERAGAEGQERLFWARLEALRPGGKAWADLLR